MNIDEHLLEAARELAIRTKRPLGDVVDDALRLLLAQTAELATAELDLPTFGGSGLRPGVDLENRERLDALLGEAPDG